MIDFNPGPCASPQAGGFRPELCTGVQRVGKVDRCGIQTHQSCQCIEVAVDGGLVVGLGRHLGNEVEGWAGSSGFAEFHPALPGVPAWARRSRIRGAPTPWGQLVGLVGTQASDLCCRRMVEPPEVCGHAQQPRASPVDCGIDTQAFGDQRLEFVAVVAQLCQVGKSLRDHIRVPAALVLDDYLRRFASRGRVFPPMCGHR